MKLKEPNAIAQRHWENLAEKINDLRERVEKIEPKKLTVGQLHEMMERINDIQMYRNNFLIDLFELNYGRPPFEMLGDKALEARHLLQRPITKVQFGLFGDLQTAVQYKRVPKIKVLKTKILQHLKYLHNTTRGLSQLFGQKASAEIGSVHEVLKKVQEDRKTIADYDKTTSPEFEIQRAKASIDPDLIYWAVQELIENATKATKNNPKPNIQVRNYAQDQTHVIEVQDNGIGIKPESLNRIFDGYSGFRDEHRMPGSGLILPNIKRVIEMHKGQIQVESKPGHGTTFQIVLPANTPRRTRS